MLEYDTCQNKMQCLQILDEYSIGYKKQCTMAAGRYSLLNAIMNGCVDIIESEIDAVHASAQDDKTIHHHHTSTHFTSLDLTTTTEYQHPTPTPAHPPSFNSHSTLSNAHHYSTSGLRSRAEPRGPGPVLSGTRNSVETMLYDTYLGTYDVRHLEYVVCVLT